VEDDEVKCKRKGLLLCSEQKK